MYKCKSFKDYIKVQRKTWRKKWNQRRSMYYIWLSYDITSIAQVEEAERHKKYYRGNLPIILEQFIQYKGRKMLFERWIGTLVGVQLTNEDYYWMYKIDDSDEIHYMSCVGRISLLNIDL